MIGHVMREKEQIFNEVYSFKQIIGFLKGVFQVQKLRGLMERQSSDRMNVDSKTLMELERMESLKMDNQSLYKIQ